MNEHCNILILSVTAGNGHNSAAAALKEEFDRQGVNCHIMDLFQYLSPLAAKLISDGYDQLTKRFRLAWKIGYGVALHDTTFKIPPRLIASTSNLQSMQQYLIDQKITHVVFTHPFAGVLLQTLKQYQAIAIPTFGILTDFTIHPYWWDCTENDYFILPHADLIPAAEKNGFQRKQLKDFGIPVSSAFARPPEKMQVRTMLGMPVNLPTVLVMEILSRLCRRLTNTPSIRCKRLLFAVEIPKVGTNCCNCRHRAAFRISCIFMALRIKCRC